MNNYLNFSDVDGVNFNVVSMERNPGCVVCAKSAVTIDVHRSTTFGVFLDKIKERFHLDNPTVSSAGGPLYMINTLMEQMADISRDNLKRSLPALNIGENAELSVVDDSLRQPITLRIKYVAESNESSD